MSTGRACRCTAGGLAQRQADDAPHADGFGITDAARRYLRPLIAGESYPAYRDGLPDYAVLRNESVPKRLPQFAA